MASTMVLATTVALEGSEEAGLVLEIAAAPAPVLAQVPPQAAQTLALEVVIALASEDSEEETVALGVVSEVALASSLR